MPPICRLCLQSTTEALITTITNEHFSQINLIIPEIDLGLVKSPQICYRCLEALKAAYEFKLNCLESEKKVEMYSEANGMVNLEDLLSSDYEKDETKDEEDVDVKIENDKNDGENLSCDICGKGYNTIKSKERHRKTHFNKPTCKTCGKTFYDTANLLKHNRRFHELESSESETEIKFEERKAIEKSDCFCSECNRKFSSKKCLNLHIKRMHLNKKKSGHFKCEYCKNSYVTLPLLEKHVKSVHDQPKNYFCTFCESGFSTKYLLQRHVDSLHYDKREIIKYVCKFCDEEFTTQTDLLDHRRETHSDVEKKRCTCEICGATFSKDTLEVHLRTHTGERPFKCDECGKAFTQSSSLWTHKQQKHSNERPYACGFCPKRFPLKGSLTKHLQDTHLGDKIEKKYKCRYCPKAYRVESKLVYHVRWHTNERKHACDVCAKAFVDKSSMLKHRVIHSDEKRHVCEVCGKGFHQKYNMKIHMKVHSK